MNNNLAFLAELKNKRAIPNANFIVLMDVVYKGVPIAPVITGVDTPEGQKVIYFDANLCLEDAFIESIDRLSPQYGDPKFKSLATYLSKGNRVKAIKLKGVISNGLVVEVEKVQKVYGLIDDDWSGDTIFGQKICHKYVVPKTHTQGTGKNKQTKGKRESRMVENQFRFHIDTLQLLRNLHCIRPLDVISVTRKVHGTSSICANVLVKRPMKWYEHVQKFFNPARQYLTYDYVYASRKVVKNADTNQHFYTEDIWTRAGKDYFLGKLHAGETVYFEIVGYLSDGKMIQKHYDYGCKPGEYKIQVYRMTTTNSNGDVVEYSWPKVKARCLEMGVPHVEEFYFGTAMHMFPDPRGLLPNWNNPAMTDEQVDAWRVQFAQKLKEAFLEQDVPVNLCRSVPDEGIVIKVENGDELALKLKSDRFWALESEQAEQGEDDIESAEGGSDA